MKTHGTLTKKEELGSNFKLVFQKEKDSKEFFLILHGKQRHIFNELKINFEYSFN
jgi:hypothetical protein